MLEAGGAEVARPPAFAGEPDEEPGLLKQGGIDRELIGEDAVVVDGFLELPGIAPGEDGGAAGAALGVGGEGVGEEDAFAGDAIEVGRAEPLGAVGSGVAVGPVVGDDEEDVGAAGGLGHESLEARQEG